MSHEQTATQRRILKMETVRGFDLMSGCTELEQAERIALHYLSLAATAQHLREIIRLVNPYDMTDDTKAAIRYLAEQIKTTHAHDLGIELTWPRGV